MKRTLLLLLAISCLFTACDQDDLSEPLSDVLYVQNDGAQMPAYIYGNGANKDFIIVIHGGPGGTGLEYRAGQYAEDLEEKYAMVYWDQRGQGMSQGRYDEADVTVEQMAEDLEKLILVIQAKYGGDLNIFLLGHSWGGTLGTAFLLDSDRQALVTGWIEADGAHDIPRLNNLAINMFLTIGTEQIALGNSTDKWQEIIDFANSIDTNNITTEQSGEINGKAGKAEEALANDGFIHSGGGFSSLNSALPPTNPLTAFLSGNVTSNLLLKEVEVLSMTDRLSEITIPCLFLWGKYDFVVSPGLGADAFAKVNTTDKKLVIFQNSGHSPMDNEPTLFVQEVVEFVDAH